MVITLQSVALNCVLIVCYFPENVLFKVVFTFVRHSLANKVHLISVLL